MVNPSATAAATPQEEPLGSIHTSNFPAILNELGISLVVSTYQAGKLIVLRADGETINTHFRIFKKPMGIAATRDRLAIGTAYQVWELRNMPALTDRLEPRGKHDACYLPRNVQITGDIDIHEMAWDRNNQLWIVNTRFSCLCTLDRDHSFVPRWKPPFISSYDLSDRCHLNGLGMRDGKPRYVSALGTTDTANGWRKQKANGGIIMDIDTNEIIAQGLSMPHSPRWYNNKLWVLESGKGTLSQVNPETQEVTTVAELPGFTRGLTFWGNLAFIGLSQVRESAVFSGIPLTQTMKERICGVWVVRIDTGETIAFLKFQGAINEIFAISVLPGIKFPEIIDWNEQLLSTSYALPDAALQQVDRSSEPVESPYAYYSQGNNLYHNGKLSEAIAAYRQCLTIQPDFLPARYNLGVTLGDLEEYEQAIIELEQVVTAEASYAEAHNSLGYIYSRQRNLDRAIQHYEKAIEIAPKYAKAHHNLGMMLLLKGDLIRGFTESEWRWQTREFVSLECPHPQWKGEDISDKTILIHTEQDAGDAIQFIRFLPQVAQRAKKVILVCSEVLKPLLSTAKGVDRVITPGTISLSDFQTYAPLMSLPHIFQTTLETIPDTIPYLEVPAATTFTLPEASANHLKVGIVWGGSPTQGNDPYRSSKLADWLPLLRVPDVTFYSLQKGEQRVAELNQIPLEVKIHNLDSQLNHWGDTAQAVSELDLVITIDTGVAHLAGALGKPVWVLLCHNADWRWLLNREDSPWYPSMRLFRQSQAGVWGDLLEIVKSQFLAIL